MYSCHGLTLTRLCLCVSTVSLTENLTYIFSPGNTNGTNFELYALLGETYGKGLPLGYVLVQSNGGGKTYAKERLLSQFLAFIRDVWGIQAIITLSDKDPNEIAALRKCFPDAKHQMCFWHNVRAIKTRLAILRRTPGPYNAAQAKAEFPWIDENFVPINQRTKSLVQ